MIKKNYTSLKAGVTLQSVTIVLVTVLLLSSVPAMVTADETETEYDIIETFSFSQPVITELDTGKLEATVAEISEKTTNPDEFVQPVNSHIFELPLGCTDIVVSVDQSEIQTMEYAGEFSYGPKRAPLTSENYPLLERFGQLFSKRVSVEQQDIPQTMQTLASPEHEPFFSSEFCDINIWVGRNEANELKTFAIARITPCQIAIDTIRYIEEVTIKISYTQPSQSLRSLDDTEEYDLLIITADAYVGNLAPLVTHKEDMGLKTKLVSLSDIYNKIYFEENNYLDEPRDEQEQIKYFIYNAVQEWDVTYVMAVGGYRTFFGLDVPSKQFPVRYSHLNDGAEPGYACDQYYSYFLAYDEVEGFVFDTWDSNGNDRFAEWDWQGFDSYDPLPDVYFGRLACRNKIEVNTMVDKIITYETKTYGSEWFNKILSITGDGFQDLNKDYDLSFNWNTNTVPAGDYIIYAQSRLFEDEDFKGPIDSVEITVDHSAPSRVTFYEDDHLWVEPIDPSQDAVYPGKPVAEIVVPQTGDVLGNTDVDFNPPEAYCSDNWDWGHVQYINNQLTIRGKSYDPSPQETGDMGSKTHIKYWINNTDGDMIEESGWKYSTMWYEGELECQVAHTIMTDFEATKLWTSNGQWTDMGDVIDAFSEGYGFVYFAGHGNPMSWGDHLPGIPGGRDDGMINGLKVISLDFGLARYESEEGDPMFPMDHLTNGYKQPITLVGGCHNAFIDASFMKLFMEPETVLFSVLHGGWIPECFDWWLTRMPQGGAIATIGCAGLGYGIFGDAATSGLGGWINPEFFRTYNRGHDVLGATFTQTLISYANTFDTISDVTDRKTVEEWVLLGDPSLKIGGYPPEEETGTLGTDIQIVSLPLPNTKTVGPLDQSNFIIPPRPLSSEEYQVTFNEGLDCSPQSFLSEKDGDYLVGYQYGSPSGNSIHPGFAFTSGGVTWSEIIYANPVDVGCSSLTTYVEDGNTRYTGSICFDATNFGALHIPDITDPYSWDSTRYYFPSGMVHSLGLSGLTVTGYDENQFGGMWDCVWDGSDAILFMFAEDSYVHAFMLQGTHFDGDVDDVTGRHFWVAEIEGGGGIIMKADPPSTYDEIQFSESFENPSVTANNSHVYIAYGSDEAVKCRSSSNNGASWTTKTVTTDGSDPKVIINSDGSASCYYVKNNKIYEAKSSDSGATWTDIGQLTNVNVDASFYSPFILSQDGLVYAKDDGDLYANIYLSTIGVAIGDIELIGNSGIGTTVTNSGTTNLMNATWEIQIQGDSPLGRYFGLGGTIFENLLKGRVLSGGFATDNIWLSSGRSEDIGLGSTFGIGHINVVISVYDHDGDLLKEKSEDGFLLGGHLFLYHGEE